MWRNGKGGEQTSTLLRIYSSNLPLIYLTVGVVQISNILSLNFDFACSGGVGIVLNKLGHGRSGTITHYTSLHIHLHTFPHLPSVVNITPYSPFIFTTYITIDSPWLRIRSVDSVHELTCREPYYTCVGLLVDVHVTLWRMSMEPGVAVDAGYWVLFWSWLQSWMVAVNMETYKYNSTFSLSEYWRIFASYTNLGFASVCILVNIRQYSLRLQVLLYT